MIPAFSRFFALFLAFLRFCALLRSFALFCALLRSFSRCSVADDKILIVGTWVGYSGTGDPETVRTILGLGSRIESGEGWGLGISFAKGGEVPLLIATPTSCKAQIGDPSTQGCSLAFTNIASNDGVATKITLIDESETPPTTHSPLTAQSPIITQYRADATGFHSIYNTQTAQRLSGYRQWYASDPRLLVPLPFAQPQVDNTSLHQFLQTGVIAAPRTIFRGVECLTPTPPPPSRRRRSTLLTLTEHVLRAAPADSRSIPGIFLDGSVESALIAALLIEAGYSVLLFAPDDPRHPLLYSAAVALGEHLKQPVRRLILDPIETANAFVPAVLSLLQPVTDARVPLHYQLAEQARDYVTEMWLGLAHETLPLPHPYALAPFLKDIYSGEMRLFLSGMPTLSTQIPTLAAALPSLFATHNVRVRVPFASLSLQDPHYEKEKEEKIAALLPNYWSKTDWLEQNAGTSNLLGSLGALDTLEKDEIENGPMGRVFQGLLAPRLLKQEGRFVPSSFEILLHESPAALWTLATWEAYRQGLGLL